MRNLILLFFLFLFCTQNIFANHIVGGEIEMKFIGDSLGDYKYRISLIQYFDCYQDGEVPLPNPGPDNSVTYSIFKRSDGSLVENRTMFITSQTFVPYTNPACAVGFICTIRVVYSHEIYLNPNKFDDPEGYDISWARCCRNKNTKNLVNPRYTGMVYSLHFPPIRKDGKHFVNSSPRLFPPLSDYACVNQLFYTDFAGSDDDGDSIVYSLSHPLDDNQPNQLPGLVALPGNYPPPYQLVEFGPDYSVDNMIPGNPKLNISNDGFITVKPSSLGLFVFSIKYEEFRNGTKLGEGRRDFQMLVVDGCDPPIPPDAVVKLPSESDFYNEVDTIRFTVSEPKCFDFYVTDQNEGTNIKLEAQGVNFKLADDIFSFTEGQINEAGDTLKVEVCVSDCPYVENNEPYLIDLIASDDACPLPQKDTVRLIIEIKSPENQNPYFVNKNDTTKVKILWNSNYSEIIQGIDPDNDSLVLKYLYDGYIPEENGIFITNNFNIPGSLESTLTFDANCKKYNYNEKNKFLFGLVLDDLDTCNLLNTDTIFYEFEVELPENTNPDLTSDLSITNPLPDRPNYSEIVRNVDLSGVFSMQLFSDDVDNDTLVISAQGVDFDYQARGATFSANNFERGHVEGSFNWDMECINFRYDGTNTYKINFITEDIDQCQEVNSDTIQLTLNIDLPENKAPEITNLDTYKLIVNNEFKIDINAIEPDNQLVFLDLISTSPKGNFSFLSSSGIGSTSSTLSWTPTCEFLDDNFSEKSYNLTFRATDNSCPIPEKKLKIIKFLVSMPDSIEYNFSPPNAFSPNGDGKNDTYKLSGLSNEQQNLPKDQCDDKFDYIAFYDRNGLEVFRSYDRNFEWNGSGLESGTYYYYIKYSKTNSRHNYKGNVSLIY